MKRSKRLLVLAAVLVVLCVGVFAISRYEQRQEQLKSADTVLLSLSADTVQSLSWEREGTTLSFHRGEDGWLCDEDEAFPVSEEKINKILSRYASFGVHFIIENVEDYAQYGLDEPEGTLHLTTDTETYTLRFGNFSNLDAQRYVDIGDGSVYLVSDDPMDDLSAERSELIAHDTLPTLQSAQELQFTGAETYTIVQKDADPDGYQPEDIYYAQLADDEALALDTELVEAYLETLGDITLLDYASYCVTEEELRQYGLDEPTLSVSVQYTQTDEDGNEQSAACTLHLGQNVEELAAYEEAVEAGEDELPTVTKYARVGDSQIVYTLSESDYTALLRAGTDALRHQNVFWADFDSVQQIDATLEEQTHTLFAVQPEEDEDATVVWQYDETELDISALQSALCSLRAESFTDEQPTDKLELQLDLTLDRPACPRVTIALYRYDGNSCLAVVDGEPVCLVSRAEAMDLVEALQAIVLNKTE